LQGRFASIVRQGRQGEQSICTEPSASPAEIALYGAKSEIALYGAKSNARQFWTNAFPTDLVAKHQKEIGRFKWAMRTIRWTEAVWALIPIKITLKIWGFSDE
jgi:hypothetical protein